MYLLSHSSGAGRMNVSSCFSGNPRTVSFSLWYPSNVFLITRSSMYFTQSSRDTLLISGENDVLDLIVERLTEFLEVFFRLALEMLFKLFEVILSRLFHAFWCTLTNPIRDRPHLGLFVQSSFVQRQVQTPLPFISFLWHFQFPPLSR